MDGDNGQKIEVDAPNPMAVLHGGFHHGVVVPDAAAFYNLPVMLIVKGAKAGLMYKEVYKPRGCTDGAKVWNEPWLHKRPEALILVEQIVHGVIDSIRCKFSSVNLAGRGAKAKYRMKLGYLKSAEIVVGLRSKPAPVPVVFELINTDVLVCPLLNQDGTASCVLNDDLTYKLSDHIVDKDKLPKEKKGEHDDGKENATAGT